MSSQALARPLTCDLTFQAFDRSVHPELIGSVMSRAFERDGYRLRLHLTAAGHFLEWRLAKTTIVEALSEQSQPMPEHRQLFAHRVGNERAESFAPSEGVRYQTCFQLERLPPEIFHHVHDELRRDGEREGLLHLFQPQDRLGFSPLSYVDLQARPNSLLVHIYHTYPDEHAIVKSQTLIEILG